MKVIIIGGGWAGCAAALTAKKAGAEVHIYEKTDLLLGLGNVGGIIMDVIQRQKINCFRWWRFN